MNRPIVLTIGALAAIATCAGVLAQVTIEPANTKDVLIRINGPIHIGAADSAATVVVVNDEALVEGRITEQLIVVNGKARVSGTVGKNVIVAGGQVELLKGARVGEDVTLFRSTISRDSQSTIAGNVIERSTFSFSQRSLLWFWVGMTLAVVVAGLLYAAIAPHSLTEASSLLTAQPGNAALAVLAVWCGIPLAAFLAIITVIGIPLAIALMVFLLPALWFLGYLVVGARVGVAVARSGGGEASLYLTVTAGVVLLQTVGLIPGLGGLVVCLAGIVGAGVLVLRAWENLRASRTAGLAGR